MPPAHARSRSPRTRHTSRSERRLGIGIAVSVLLHGVLLSLQFGVPGLDPGSGGPIDVMLAPPLPALPVPAPPVSTAPPTTPLPSVASPPMTVPPSRPATGLRLVDLPPAPSLAVPIPVPIPAPVQARPKRARPAPVKRRLRSVAPSVIVAAPNPESEFLVPLPDVVAGPEPLPAIAATAEPDLPAPEEASDASDDAERETEQALAQQAADEQRLRQAALEQERLAEEARAAEAARLAAEQALDARQRDAAAAAALQAQAAERERAQLEAQRLAQQRLDEEALRKHAEAERQQLEARQLEAQQQQAQQLAREQAREREQQLAARQRREALERQQAEELAQRSAEQERERQQVSERARAEAERVAAQRLQDAARQAAAERMRAHSAAGPGSGPVASTGLGAGSPGAGSGAGQGAQSGAPSGIPGSRAQELLRGLTIPGPGLPLTPGQGPDSRRRALANGSERDAPLRLYVDSVRQKLERNAVLGGARLALREVRTDPLVSLALRSDGSVESVTIVRSSGRQEVDDAVRRFVELNARYSAFPPNVAAHFDVIEIRRIWRFSEGLKLLEEMR